ncbi:Acyl-CoA synthetase [Spironucleus salmonicida]|uniref:Acyl-CoA synthetase n=1 Tax=Spironucleus salmonicida TaxID=348837 RepID=V6LEB5_9EUKA|nr:Acyl-CoA synthetase [Spironucleus salmonicida]|eukprot:EST42817.1 Acyl-CoA synthetase [Spironucleus salmonicida]
MLPADFDSTFTPPKHQSQIEKIFDAAIARSPAYLYEFEAYELFKLIGIPVPNYAYFPLEKLDSAISFLQPGTDYVAKCHIPNCLHKTEIGGVVLRINRANFQEKMQIFTQKLSKFDLQGVIFVEMAAFSQRNPSNGELLISAFNDDSFGPQLCFGMGGTGVEFYAEMMQKPNVFLPVFVNFRSTIVRKTILELPIMQFLLGKVRGFEAEIEQESVFAVLENLANFVRFYSKMNEKARYAIEEIEVNPAVICKNQLLALDGVVKISKNERKQAIFVSEKPLDKMNMLFCAKRVLIAGASSKNENNAATVILRKYQKLPENVRPEIFCLHPKETEMYGCKCYKSVKEILEMKIDLVILGTAAEPTCQLITQLVEANACKAIFTLAGGFAETEKGAENEKKLRQLISVTENRPLINGPNTVGYKYVRPDKSEINTVFLPAFKSSGENATGHENCAIIAQSGAFLLSRVSNLAGRVAPKFSISVGNQLDLSAVDCLEWFLTSYESNSKQEAEIALEKDKVQVFGVYIEGLLQYEGIRLMQLIARAKQQKKLVILYKAGRSKQGSDAVSGHTASLAGSYTQFSDLVDLAGGVICETADAFEDAVFAACCLVPRLRDFPCKIALSGQSNAGFERCAIADHLFYRKNENYVVLSKFEEKTNICLSGLFKLHKLEGVIDVQQILDTTALIPDSAMVDITRTLQGADEVDASVISLIPEVQTIKTLESEIDESSVIAMYLKLWKENKNIWVISISCGWKYDFARQYLIKGGMPVFDQVDRASRALEALLRGWVGRYGKE